MEKGSHFNISKKFTLTFVWEETFFQSILHLFWIMWLVYIKFNKNKEIKLLRSLVWHFKIHN